MHSWTAGRAVAAECCFCRHSTPEALPTRSYSHQRSPPAHRITTARSGKPTFRGCKQPTATGPEAVEVQRPQRRVTEDWDELRRKRDSSEAVEVKVEKVNRTGGLFLLHGVQGIIPYSFMDFTRLPENSDGMTLDFLVGKAMTVKLITVDEDERRLVGSELAFLAQQLAEKLKEGDVVEGVISHCRDYGAFVRLGVGKSLQGVEGLIHISELSWNKIFTPEAVVQPGSFVRCKVVSTEPKAGKISLSLKQMEPDPLQERLDTVLPAAEGREQMAFVPTELPSTIEDIVTALKRQPGIDGVSIGRQAEEKAVSQDLEIWMSNAKVENGFALVARAGKLVQEIKVTTSLSKEHLKSATQAVLSELTK